MYWLSYWTDIDKLQRFATSAAHRFAQNGYATGKYSHMGIMHETYKAPRGSWETIYHNMPPSALGKMGTNKHTSRFKTDIRKENRSCLQSLEGLINLLGRCCGELHSQNSRPCA